MNPDLARIREQLFGLHLLMLQAQRTLTDCDRQLDAINRGLEESGPIDFSPVRTVTDNAPVLPTRLSLDHNPEGPQG